MRRPTTITMICGACALTAALATPARAQVNDRQTPNGDNRTDPDGTKRGEDQTGGADLGSFVINPGTKDTVITFSAPVQLPNVTLPAGSYVFRTVPGANTGSLGDHVVQVSDKDRKHAYGMFMTLPNDRIEPTDKTVVMFEERPAGVPQAVKVWFYPGNPIGEEFIYPKNEAIEIAKAYHTTVLTAEGRVDEGGQATKREESQPIATSGTATPAATDRDRGQVVREKSEPVATSGTTIPAATDQDRAPATAPAAQEPPPPASTASATTAPKRLPGTASELGLFELLSGLSFVGALGVRRLRKHIN